MNEHVTPVTDDSFDAEVLQSTIPVLVDFWAQWCGPCKMIAPTVDAIAEEFVNKIKVTKVNVDESNKTATEYNIRGIPTLMIFKDGKVAASKTGALTKAQLAEFINGNL